MPASRYATATFPISASDFQGCCGGTSSIAAALTCKGSSPTCGPGFPGPFFFVFEPIFGWARRRLRQNCASQPIGGLIACALAYHIPKCPAVTLAREKRASGRIHDHYHTTGANS